MYVFIIIEPEELLKNTPEMSVTINMIININYHICMYIKVVYNEYGNIISNLVLEYQEIRIS